MSVASRLIAKLAPWNTEAATSDLERYAKAIAKPYEAVAEVAEEVGEPGQPGWVPPYGKIFNPTTCPNRFLPWLGMFVGVEVPKMATETEARALIKEEPGLIRGTTEAIEGAIYRNTKITRTSQTLVERGILIERREASGAESQWWGIIAVEAALIPSLAALEAAVNKVKPAPIFFTYATSAKYTWAEATGKWEADTFAWPLASTKKP